MNLFGRKQPEPPDNSLRCSFCNKSQRYVKKLIAGPNVYICDECVDICLDVISHAPQEAVHSMPSAATTCSICHLPFPLEEGLHLEARGVLCRACVEAVQSALAE